jgi:hypothetical protein
MEIVQEKTTLKVVCSRMDFTVFHCYAWLLEDPPTIWFTLIINPLSERFFYPVGIHPFRTYEKRSYWSSLVESPVKRWLYRRHINLYLKKKTSFLTIAVPFPIATSPWFVGWTSKQWKVSLLAPQHPAFLRSLVGGLLKGSSVKRWRSTDPQIVGIPIDS